MKLTAAAEGYFADLRRVRASGGATKERSLYGPLDDLLTAVGATVRPKVFCSAFRNWPTRVRAIPTSASTPQGRCRRARRARGRLRSEAWSR